MSTKKFNIKWKKEASDDYTAGRGTKINESIALQPPVMRPEAAGLRPHGAFSTRPEVGDSEDTGGAEGMGSARIGFAGVGSARTIQHDSRPKVSTAWASPAKQQNNQEALPKSQFTSEAFIDSNAEKDASAAKSDAGAQLNDDLTLYPRTHAITPSMGKPLSKVNKKNCNDNDDSFTHEQEIFFATPGIQSLSGTPSTPFAVVSGFGVGYTVNLSQMPVPITNPPIPEFPAGTYIEIPPISLPFTPGGVSAVIRKPGLVTNLQVTADVFTETTIPVIAPSTPPTSPPTQDNLPLVFTFVAFKAKTANDKGIPYGTFNYILQPLQVSLVFTNTSTSGAVLSASNVVHGPGFRVDPGDRIGVVTYGTGSTAAVYSASIAANLTYRY